MNGCFCSWLQDLFLQLQLCRKSFFSLSNLLSRATDSQGRMKPGAHALFFCPADVFSSEVMKGTHWRDDNRHMLSLWVTMMAVWAEKEKCQCTVYLGLVLFRWNIPSAFSISAVININFTVYWCTAIFTCSWGGESNRTYQYWGGILF